MTAATASRTRTPAPRPVVPSASAGRPTVLSGPAGAPTPASHPQPVDPATPAHAAAPTAAAPPALAGALRALARASAALPLVHPRHRHHAPAHRRAASTLAHRATRATGPARQQLLDRARAHLATAEHLDHVTGTPAQLDSEHAASATAATTEGSQVGTYQPPPTDLPEHRARQLIAAPGAPQHPAATPAAV